MQAMSSIVADTKAVETAPNAPSPMRRHGVGAKIVVAFLHDAIVRSHDRALRRIDKGGHPAPIDDAIPLVFARPAGNRHPAIATRTSREPCRARDSRCDRPRRRRRDCGRSAPSRASLHRASRRFGPHHGKQCVEGSVELRELHRAKRKAKAPARIAGDTGPCRVSITSIAVRLPLNAISSRRVGPAPSASLNSALRAFVGEALDEKIVDIDKGVRHAPGDAARCDRNAESRGRRAQ